MSEMSASDYAMINGNNGWCNNPFMYLVFLFLFRGGWGNFGSDAATQGALTRGELTEGLNNQTLQRDVTDVRDAIGNVGAMIQTASSGISDKLCCGFNTVNTSILNSENALASAIANVGFGQQASACEINRNIDSIRYEMANNTCKITSAIHEEGELTRKAMIDQEIQNLRDSRESVQRELQSAQLTLANANQTSNILNAVGRYVPYAGCGTTCGCSSW